MIEWKKKRFFLLKCSSFCFQSHHTQKTLSDNSLDSVLWSEIKANEHGNIQYVNARPCFLLPHWISHLSDFRVKPLKPKWQLKSYLLLGTLYGLKKKTRLCYVSSFSGSMWAQVLIDFANDRTCEGSAEVRRPSAPAADLGCRRAAKTALSQFVQRKDHYFLETEKIQCD